MTRAVTVRTRVISEEPAGSGLLRRGLGATVFVSIILWGAFFLIARTDGFRMLVQDAASQRLGITTTIEQVRMVFPLSLRLKGVKTIVRPDGSYLGAGEAWLTPGRRGLLSKLVLRDVDAIFVRASAELWEPSKFSVLGEIPDRGVQQLGRSLVRLLNGRRVRVERGSARWLNEDQTVHAAVDNVVLTAVPVRIPGHDGYFFEMDVGAGTEPNGGTFQGIGCEWLTTDVLNYVELMRSGLAPTTSKYWGDINE